MRRTLRALLVVTFVAGQVGAAAHNLLVSHVTCLEHGEVIHSGAPAEPDLGQPTERATRQGARGHEHDVCLIALHRRESAGPAVVVPISSAIPLIAPAPPIVAPPLRGQSVFRLAPKTSPPV